MSDILTYEFHSELAPQVWSGDTLDPEIRDKLLENTVAFLDSLDIDVEIEDITLTGSLANYNYTKYSDFDLHIITDLKKYDVDQDLLKDYFNAKRTIWNTTHDVTIKGYNVELYIQDISEAHHSTGVYSLKDDEWVVKPVVIKDKKAVDPELVQKKKQTMLDIINFVLTPECDIECALRAKEKFMNYRKAGLEKEGDLAPENLAFKELRRSGDIEKLVKGIHTKRDRELSLDSIQEVKSFKNLTTLGAKRGPRHQSPVAGIRKLTNPDAKTLGTVAQMHKIGTEDPAVYNLKKQAGGTISIPEDRARTLAASYGLQMDKIMGGYPRQLSTSGIELGYDPQSNTFYLRK